LAIGVNALAAWAIGALLLFSPQATWRIIALALFIVAAYFSVVLLGVNGFVVAIAMALPAALFLLVGLLVAHWRDSRRGALLAAAGVVTTLAAALVQQLGVGAHSVYFNHNATAHVVQIVALALIFVGSRQLLHVSGDDLEGSVACLHDATF
jgi:peptidoglycan/LPS O-acetylase OafA/YrhL